MKRVLLLCTWIMIAIINWTCSSDPQPVPPEITSISPVAGPGNSTITIKGKFFGVTTSRIIVYINGKWSSISTITDTEIVVKVGPMTGTGPVIVTTPGGSATGPTFTYIYTVQVSTFAGTGSTGSSDAVGTASSFNFPGGIASTESLGPNFRGDLYVGDRVNQKIRKITSAGLTSTYTGTGTSGGVDGNISMATYNGPNGVAVDNAENLFVTEINGNRVRKITWDGTVTTLAGNGTAGFADGDGTSAQFDFPVALVIDRDLNLIVADYNNHRIRKISPTGTVTTLAGTGAADYVDGVGNIAAFHNPSGIAMDAQGNFFVCELGNRRIRKVTALGTVSTYAGDGGQGNRNGDRLSAQFAAPRGIAIDIFGNLLVADDGNQLIRIIEPTGNVSTLAGSGVVGFDNGTGPAASFNSPYCIAVVATGEIMVGERMNAAIRKITYF